MLARSPVCDCPCWSYNRDLWLLRLSQAEKLPVLAGPVTPAPPAGNDGDPSFRLCSGRARDRMDAYRDTAIAASGDIRGDVRVSDPYMALDPDRRVPSDWPRAGGVRFEGVRLRYSAASGGAGGPGCPSGSAAGSAGDGRGAQAAARDASTGAAEPAWALAGLDLELHPGERLGLVGRTGVLCHCSHL